MRDSDSEFRQAAARAIWDRLATWLPTDRGMMALFGSWPGDETEEEIAAALEELS